MSDHPSKPPKKSKLAISHPDVVRVPRSLARVTLPIVTEPAIEGGKVIVERTIRAEHVLRAIAAIGRRDNATRQMVWRNTDMNKRVGVTATKGGANTVSLLHQIGVIEAYSRKTAGTPYTVTVAKVEDTQSLQLPLAALWEHRWTNGNIIGPRYGKQTAVVARVLLALLAYGDWSDDYTKVNCLRSNAFLTKHLGLGKGTWADWWAIFCEAVAEDAWIVIEETRDAYGGYGPWRIKIDWNLLPAMEAAPALADEGDPVEQAPVATDEQSGSFSPDRGGSFSPDRGGSSSPNRVGHLHHELKEDSALESVLSDPVPSSQRRKKPATQTAHKKAEEEMETAATVTDLRMQDAIRKGLKSQQAGDGDMDSTTTDYDTWLLAVVAILADASTPNRPGVSLCAAQRLHGLVRDHYAAGWKAQPLVAALTVREPPRNLYDALPTRVAEVPEQPNYTPVALDRKALAERAAYDAAASSRSADKYAQRTL